MALEAKRVTSFRIRKGGGDSSSSTRSGCRGVSSSSSNLLPLELLLMLGGSSSSSSSEELALDSLTGLLASLLLASAQLASTLFSAIC